MLLSQGQSLDVYVAALKQVPSSKYHVRGKGLAYAVTTWTNALSRKEYKSILNSALQWRDEALQRASGRQRLLVEAIADLAMTSYKGQLDIANRWVREVLADTSGKVAAKMLADLVRKKLLIQLTSGRYRNASAYELTIPVNKPRSIKATPIRTLPYKPDESV